MELLARKWMCIIQFVKLLIDFNMLLKYVKVQMDKAGLPTGQSRQKPHSPKYVGSPNAQVSLCDWNWSRC